MENAMESVIYDLIGVGFGPSNLALAIALNEREQVQNGLNYLFLDKQTDYQWHGNTLVAQSELQISFLKDLVSLRNPTSHYSFVNYLQAHGRLVDFINLGTFYPCRMEFNDYLRWVASHFTNNSRYGENILAIEPVLENDKIETLRVVSCDVQGKESVRNTRSVVISAGGTALIPSVFDDVKGNARIFHHSEYLSRMREQPCVKGKPMRIAVIGGGQSAAEAFIDLNDSYPSVQADLIFRGSSLKPADSSPFVNEVFTPDFTDLIYKQKQAKRDHLVNEYQNTNYSVVDMPLIERIYTIFYRQRVSGIQRHTLRRSQSVEAVTAVNQGIKLALHDTMTGDTTMQTYDVVILATGYERQQHRELLAPLDEYIGDYTADYTVDRNYRLQADKRCNAAIYLQGFCEETHGLSDTLLSVLAIRADEIAMSLYAFLQQGVEANIAKPQLEAVE